jgi:hypothetical protein
LKVVGAGYQTAFVLGPVKTKDRLLMQAIDLVDGRNLLVLVLFEQLLHIEDLEDG